MINQDTIVAQATPPGRGGVGIIRVSGTQAKAVAEHVLGKLPKPRYADYLPFKANGQVIDQGIALYFVSPNSFTGEDVLELQGHGGPVVMDMLLKEICKLKDVRMAKPGEFSERAFLNDKLDLAQAEAIADLIDASSEQAAKSALNSLQGAFSNEIHQLVEQVIHLRLYVEAAIDFPDEEGVDFITEGDVEGKLKAIISQLDQVQQEARQGSLLREGMKVVLAGRPNAGKSSLLNALAGRESAIVTEVAGTTRDVLREHIHIDGMPLHIIDTAGLRETQDKVEQIGIERAWQEIDEADLVLFLIDSTETDATDPHDIWPEFIDKLPDTMKITVIRNKADLSGEAIEHHDEGCSFSRAEGSPVISLSAKSGEGIDQLRNHLKASMGYQGAVEGKFMARRRHLDALEQAHEHLEQGLEQLQGYSAGELLAEDLRQCQQDLNEITGEFTSDDLLGRIFGSFCIGK